MRAKPPISSPFHRFSTRRPRPLTTPGKNRSRLSLSNSQTSRAGAMGGGSALIPKCVNIFAITAGAAIPVRSLLKGSRNLPLHERCSISNSEHALQSPRPTHAHRYVLRAHVFVRVPGHGRGLGHHLPNELRIRCQHATKVRSSANAIRLAVRRARWSRKLSWESATGVAPAHLRFDPNRPVLGQVQTSVRHPCRQPLHEFHRFEDDPGGAAAPRGL